MGKQQTAGQIKESGIAAGRGCLDVAEARKQTGYASLLCLPHSWISHNHGACE